MAKSKFIALLVFGALTFFIPGPAATMAQGPGGNSKKLLALKLEKGQATYSGNLEETAEEPYRGKKSFKIFVIKLEQGKSYQIDHRSKAFDAYLFLEDADGKILAKDDDGGEGLNSRIVFHADKPGIFRLIATSVGNSATGPFALSVRIMEPGLPKELLAKLADSDPKVRRQALSALGQVNPKSQGFFPAVVDALLSDPEPGNRLKAMAILAQVGPAAGEAVPALIKVFKTDIAVGHQKAAIETLGKIGPAALGAEDVLIGAVRMGHVAAVTALGQIKSRKAINILVEVLEKCAPDAETGEGFREAYSAAARALGTIGVSDSRVLATLKRGLNLPGDFTGHYAEDADTALRMLKAGK